jgi:hypothetical protein
MVLAKVTWALPPFTVERMRNFDYLAPAELFVGKARGSARGSGMRYLRFPTSAEAIKYAVESLETTALLSAALVVGEDRFEAGEIAALYKGERFPLSRDK